MRGLWSPSSEEAAGPGGRQRALPGFPTGPGGAAGPGAREGGFLTLRPTPLVSDHRPRSHEETPLASSPAAPLFPPRPIRQAQRQLTPGDTLPPQHGAPMARRPRRAVPTASGTGPAARPASASPGLPDGLQNQASS